MPEHIEGTNMWNLLEGESFTANDGTVVTGPLAGLRIEEFPAGVGLLRVQTPNRILEINGETMADFKKVVSLGN